MLEDQVDVALILEDDAIIDAASVRMALVAAESVDEFDIINLGSKNAIIKRSSVANYDGYSLHRSVYYCFGAYAYLVSRRGAAKLLAAQTPRVSAYADWPVHAWNLRLFLMIPSLVSLSGRPTGVQLRVTDRPHRPLHTRAIYRARKLIWRSIGLVRTGVFQDVSV